MKKYSVKNIIILGVAATGWFALPSCNKVLPEPTPLTFPTQGTQSALEFITSDTTYSYFLAAATKATPPAGVSTLLAMLGDKTAYYTIYAPNNAAFRASGIPSVAAINSAAFRAGQLDSLLRYHIIPGEQWPTTVVPTTFPNVQLPSLLTLGTLPGTTIPFRLSLYPSKRASGSWINTIPLVGTDKILINGVLHTPAALVSPPSLLLGWGAYVVPATSAGVLSTDPQYALFDSLIVKGDNGNTGTTSFFYALNQPFANLTVFAPTNTAVKNFMSASLGVPIGSPDAVYAAVIRTSLPAANAQGIVAYHIMPTKAFSNNFTTAATVYPTLVPTSLNPGISVQAFFTGPFVDSMKVLGLAPSNGGIPATAKIATGLDKNAVNGVVHTIDKVLLPQ